MDVQHLFDSVSSGTSGFILAYSLTSVGVLLAFKGVGIRGWGLLRVPFTAIPALIVSSVSLVLFQTVYLHTKPVPVQVLISIGWLIFCGLVGGIISTNRRDAGHQRGTLLDEQQTPPRPKGRRSGCLTLAGLPLDPSYETKHFKLIGTTGTGKSTAIRELLAGALDRGDRGVIADPGGSYLHRFYDPGRGDVILNPFDPRAARWDLFGEMQTPTDADQLSCSLIADTEGTERNWRNYARVFLTSLLRQLHRVKHHDVAELFQLLSVTPLDDLRELLTDTPAESLSLPGQW